MPTFTVFFPRRHVCVIVSIDRYCYRHDYNDQGNAVYTYRWYYDVIVLHTAKNIHKFSVNKIAQTWHTVITILSGINDDQKLCRE